MKKLYRYAEDKFHDLDDQYRKYVVTKSDKCKKMYSDIIANGDVVIYNDGYMINNGEKVTAATTGWIEYVIPLDYRKFNAYPTHIVVSCAASQYGDYFTGYDKTKLWIDAVELIYE